jgi:hypothetical protein
MPCWSLDELRLAGKVLREKGLVPKEVSFADQDIVQRYQQFGGIIRYVLPASELNLKEAKLHQLDRVAEQDEQIQLMSANPDIEKKENGRPHVSHFLLQYDVDPQTFDCRGVKIASPQIFEDLAHTISNKSLTEGCVSLRNMFDGFLTQQSFKFELVVANGITRKSLKWQIHDKESQQWRPFQFPDLKLRCFAIDRTPAFAQMETGLLYRIDDPHFPLVDIFFKSAEDEVTGIQVTFAASHAKPRTVFELFRKKLRLPSSVRCRLLMVPNPKHAEVYARRQPADYLTKKDSPAADDDEERPDLDEGSSEAKRKAKAEKGKKAEAEKAKAEKAKIAKRAEFLQRTKFDIATLRLSLPPSIDQFIE